MAISVLLAVAGFGWLTWSWFLSPAVAEDLTAADAIVVLAGGGDRTEMGADLANQGLAPVVVFADPGRDSSAITANPYCNGRSALEADVVCFDPHPAKTQGEARMAALLADERGWDNIIVVASTDQVTRAQRLLGRCYDGAAQMVGVDHDSWPLVRAAYEWGATAKAHTIKRGC